MTSFYHVLPKSQERHLSHDSLRGTQSPADSTQSSHISCCHSFGQNSHTWTGRTWDTTGEFSLLLHPRCHDAVLVNQQVWQALCFYLFSVTCFLLQVIQMQCNLESVEEGAKYHVSVFQRKAVLFVEHIS